LREGLVRSVEMK